MSELMFALLFSIGALFLFLPVLAIVALIAARVWFDSRPANLKRMPEHQRVQP